MKKLSVVPVTLIILALFVAPTLAADKTFKGVIVAINVDAHTFTVKSAAGVEKTFHAEATTVFVIDGVQKLFTELSKDDPVTITYDEHVHTAKHVKNK